MIHKMPTVGSGGGGGSKELIRETYTLNVTGTSGTYTINTPFPKKPKFILGEKPNPSTSSWKGYCFYDVDNNYGYDIGVEPNRYDYAIPFTELFTLTDTSLSYRANGTPSVGVWTIYAYFD